MEALGKFEPVSTGDDGGVEQSGVVVEDESSLEDGTIVNMQVCHETMLQMSVSVLRKGNGDHRLCGGSKYSSRKMPPTLC